MLYILLFIILLLLCYGPNLWVRYAIRKHNTHLEAMPGTGGELAQHLIERFDLKGVTVEKTVEDDDHYSPGDKVVGLSPEVYDGKSISAVAIAAHEVGHAIQHVRAEPVSQLRDRYSGAAASVQSFGILVLSILPLLGIFSRSPGLMIIGLVAGLIAMFGSVALHALVLPEELDASFAKALPVLGEGYISDEQLPAAREVLRACAFTYIAQALSDVLSLWRWIAILK